MALSEENKHSPEPWHYVGDSGAIEDASGHMCAEAWVREDANARRIVAAVNACAGLSTEALEKGLIDQALSLLRYGYTNDEEIESSVVEVLRALGRLP